MSDWLDVNLPVITKTHGEMMRGALPPALIQLKAEADTDLSDYRPVAGVARESSGPGHSMYPTFHLITSPPPPNTLHSPVPTHSHSWLVVDAIKLS